jgi:hypothetical protein
MFLMMSITLREVLLSKSNITLWLVRNLASARANQAAGSEIQKAGRVSLLGCGGTASTASGDCWGQNGMLPMLAIQL